MPRRNRRAGFEFVTMERTLLGDDYKFTRDHELDEQRRKRRIERAARIQQRMVEDSRKNWTKCILPGCNFQVPKELEGTGIAFPMCSPHIAVAVRHVLRNPDRFPQVTEAEAALEARARAIQAEIKAEDAAEEAEYRASLRRGDAIGEIYYVRVSGLIKVGWTAGLHSRVRSYGPTAELLAHYTATRNQEKLLHQQLTPSRAKGREWYHEDDILKRYIAEAVDQHGEPEFTRVNWTEPAQLTAAKAWRGRKAS